MIKNFYNIEYTYLAIFYPHNVKKFEINIFLFHLRENDECTKMPYPFKIRQGGRKPKII